MKKNGFTIIEMLVVIAILAVITSLVFSLIRKSSDRVKIGDKVIIESIDTVGIVNRRIPPHGLDILTTNGLLKNINVKLVKKFPQPIERE